MKRPMMTAVDGLYFGCLHLDHPGLSTAITLGLPEIVVNLNAVRVLFAPMLVRLDRRIEATVARIILTMHSTVAPLASSPA